MNSNIKTTHNGRLKLILITAALLLTVPLIAMQFTTEVKWSAFDFIIMGILLLSTGLAVEFTLRKIRKPAYRLMACFGILVILFLVWAELAVGIFGSPFAGS